MNKKSFDIFKNKCNLKISYLMQKADKYGFNSVDDFENNDYLVLTKLIQEDFDTKLLKKFTTLNVTFNMLPIFKNLNNKKNLKEYYENMICHGVYHNLITYEDMFVDFIVEKMKQKEVIYLFSDLKGYGVDDEQELDYENYEYKEDDYYHLHGCSIILIPCDEGYKLFYINPHGRDMKTTNEFEIRLSSTRKKTIKFKHSLDVVMIKNFVDYLNTEHSTNIIYDHTKKYNYYGANLQSGDDHGICFIYPFIIYYCFGKYYNTIMKEDIIFDTAKNLLLGNRLIDFVHYCFIDYDDRFYEILTTESEERYRINKMEYYLEKLSYRFVKNVMYTILSYTCQSYFIKKL